jgi:signal transduction histidine kinase
MRLSHLWETVSNSGVHAGLGTELERKVKLCNQISFSVGLALFIGALNHLSWGYTVLAPFMMLFALLYFFVPYLNARGHHTLSRAYLTILPPLLITMLSGLILYRDSSFKFALIPVILVPILVFGISERRRMLFGIAWVVFAFMALDGITPLIPPLAGVTVGDAEMAQNAKVNGLITFFMFSASFIYFQRLNQKAENALSATLQEVQAQQAIIERQNREEQEQSALALAKQREVNALKTTFVAMTSHEFRTPLAAILSAQELLRDFGESMARPARDELFSITVDAVQRMTGMLDKILIIGQADADLLDFNPQPLNIHQVCARLVDEAQRSSPGTASIMLRAEVPEDATALLDENLLRHCLGNLLSNAVKYSPQGGQATLTVCRLAQAIRFEVVDEGIGIPAEDLPRLFESFHRASNVGSIQGTGLGLAIVMRAVERHRGSIDVSSEVGRGTRFSVLLPQT